MTVRLTEAEITAAIPFLTPAELKELDALIDIQGITDAATDHTQYADDPVGFGRDIFGEFYTDDVIRVMESVRDNPVTIAESANATGKTHGAARIAVWWYKTRDEAQVYTAAAPPLENLKTLLWGEIGSLTAKHETTVFEEDRLNYLHISRDSRNFITGVAIPATGTPAQREAKFSGKHAKNLLFILDEGDAIPHEVYKGIESCLSGEGGRLLVMYNPRSDEGPIAEMKARGVPVVRLSAMDHPNVLEGQDIIPGAVSRNKTIHRIHQWTVAATAENADMQGIGRFTVPDFLIGCAGFNEETQEPYPPLEAGERIIVQPEFSYMVLGEYPGMSRGVIYDMWQDAWNVFREKAYRHDPNLIAAVEGAYTADVGEQMRRLAGLKALGWQTQGNVSPLYDYEEGAGLVIWSIDDGYAGARDPRTGMFTADSHPRVIGFYQYKPDGAIVMFDELLMIKEPKPERQIAQALAMGYPRPEFVVIGPGSASLGGVLAEEGFYKRTCMESVEETIKHMQKWVAADDKGWRRYRVHPRCKHHRYEMTRYRRDDNGRIIKAYDHTNDATRYLLWTIRNGL